MIQSLGSVKKCPNKIQMDFDRLITRQIDADRIQGAEQAVRDGRKNWCKWRLLREIKYRILDQPLDEPVDFRNGTPQEQRWATDFRREFNQDPLDEIRQLVIQKRDIVRR